MGSFISKIQAELNKNNIYKLRCKSGNTPHTFIIKFGKCVYTFGIYTYFSNKENLSIDGFYNYDNCENSSYRINPIGIEWKSTPLPLKSYYRKRPIKDINDDINFIVKFVKKYIEEFP